MPSICVQFIIRSANNKKDTHQEKKRLREAAKEMPDSEKSKGKHSQSDKVLIRGVPSFPYGQRRNTVCRHTLSILMTKFY